MELQNGAKVVFMNTNLIPVILMGGYSTRMQQDKAFLKYQGKYWFKIIYNKLKPYFENVYLSLRKEQYEKNLSLLSPFSKTLIFDHDLSVSGPLKGMFSCYLYFLPNTQDFFLSLLI